MKRRTFLQQTVATTATTALSHSRILGANERVNLGLIGCGGRGTEVATQMLKAPGAHYAALCDVYAPNAEQAKGVLNPAGQTYGDFRKLLESKDIDAVHIATPDHWHAQAMILACAAGKDVYVEKPLAHNIAEGRAMVAAARKYNRVAQTGMQHRSAPHYREVQDIIQSGKLGEVRFVRVWNYVNVTPYGIGKFPDAPVPAGLDWEMYLGPAPYHAFNKNRFLRNFRWFSDYAGGTITDFGTHRFDTVQQIMNVSAPKTVMATGGRFTRQDDGDHPDVMQVSYEYDGFILSYEASNINGMGMGGRTPDFKYYGARGEFDRPNGEAYYGTNGTIIADRIGYELFAEPIASAKKDGSMDLKAPFKGHRIEPKRVQGRDTTDLHCADFINCVRSRKQPAGDIEIGHRSTTVPHLGNIAYRVGQKLAWDAQKEAFACTSKEVNAAATKWLSREPRKPWNLA